MKIDESTKFTLTIRQLRRLVKEATALNEAPDQEPLDRMEGDVIRLGSCNHQRKLCWGLDGFCFAPMKVNPSLSKRLPYMVLIHQDSSGWQMHFENFVNVDMKPYLDDLYKAFAKTCEEKGIKEIYAVGGFTPGGISGLTKLQQYGFKKVYQPSLKTVKDYQDSGNANIYWSSGQLDPAKAEAWLNKGTHLGDFLYLQGELEDGKPDTREVLDPKDASEGTKFTIGNTMPKPFKMVR